MTEQQIKKETPIGKIEKLDPFFKDITKIEKEKKISKEDEMIGRSANRKLEEKWNVKMQFGVDFFTELFTFLNEMGYDIILGLTKRQVKIYIIDSSGSHLCLVTIDKTEMSEYVLKVDTPIVNTEIPTETETETETLVYVEFDILDEMTLNSKYPIDVYFDTIENNTMYIINGKSLESKRLKSLDSSSDQTIGTYKTHPTNLMRWLKYEDSFIMNVSYISFSNILKALQKKKGKKDKSATKNINVDFRKNTIDFRIQSEIKSSSFQMNGDDIAIPGERDVSFLLDLEILTKLSKLIFKTNAIIHINENLPLIIETRFGAGKIHLYYLIAPRSETSDEEQQTSEEQSTIEE